MNRQRFRTVLWVPYIAGCSLASGAEPTAPQEERQTSPRLSLTDGQMSFWRLAQIARALSATAPDWFRVWQSLEGAIYRNAGSALIANDPGGRRIKSCRAR
jgi:hypothetical protein